MTACRYLYEVRHACGHLQLITVTEPMTETDYSRLAAENCPRCQPPEPPSQPEPEPAEKHRGTIWKYNRHECPDCGRPASLRLLHGRMICRDCFRVAGGLNGKRGQCDRCGGYRLRWYVEGAGMLCLDCKALTSEKAEGTE